MSTTTAPAATVRAEKKGGAWIALLVAGVFEVGYALSVNGSAGFTNPLWSAVAVVFFLFTLYFLSVALKRIDVGIGYAVWAGIGAIGAAVLGPVLFDETLTLVKGFWLAVIIAGVIWLKLADSPTSADDSRNDRDSPCHGDLAREPEATPATPATPTAAPKQLRLVVVSEDFDTALTFYRDVLGLPERAAFEGDGDARVAILDAGRATLELANPAQGKMIDRVEADGTPSSRIRVAFEVDDSASATADLVEHGATLVAAPIQTPWQSLNSRLHAPGDLDVTLFQELEPAPERQQPSGLAPS